MQLVHHEQRTIFIPRFPGSEGYWLLQLRVTGSRFRPSQVLGGDVVGHGLLQVLDLGQHP
jgi:hypothetical protein